MLLEICIHTYRYQRRLCWQLSSLLQQAGDKPDLLANISHTDNDGTPTTQEVCEFFRTKGLAIKETLLSQANFGNRSLARNQQLQETQADFILFVDSDMVYEPIFFADLKQQLLTNLKDEVKCMGADRISLSIPFCTQYFDEDKTVYPTVIENVAGIVEKWPVYRIGGKRCGAGNFQLANVKKIRERNLNYGLVHRDWLARSHADRGFRRSLGGVAPIDVKHQYHLNHSRGQIVDFQR